jgi:hypothetical protein
MGDFLAIIMSEGFETLLTTSFRIFCRSGHSKLSSRMFARTFQERLLTDALVLK